MNNMEEHLRKEWEGRNDNHESNPNWPPICLLECINESASWWITKRREELTALREYVERRKHIFNTPKYGEEGYSESYASACDDIINRIDTLLS